MADPKSPESKTSQSKAPQSKTSQPAPGFDTDEVETQHALEQGLGVGARELAALGESGEAGTLEQGEPGEAEPEEGLEVDEMGRSASVLDRKP